MSDKGKLKDWFELLRLFSWPCIILPAALGGLFAYHQGDFSLPRFLYLLAGILLIHVPITVVNEYYDVKFEIDTLEQEKPSTVLVEKRINPEFALQTAHILLFLAVLAATGYALLTGIGGVIIFAALGIFIGYFYTAPPLSFKYRGLSLPANFITLGLLIPQAVLYGLNGSLYPAGLGLSLPPALLISAILWVNDMRDIEADREIITLVGILGLSKSYYVYLMMLVLPYFVMLYYLLNSRISLLGLLTLLTLPLTLKLARQAWKGINQQAEKLAYLDEKTAVLMLIFNLIWLLGYYTM